MVEELGLDPGSIPATGPGGRLLKEDVQRFVQAQVRTGESGREIAPPAARSSAAPAPAPANVTGAPIEWAEGEEERPVPMSRIRKRIAERLVEAQHTAAILTTFNEVDMTAVIDLRSRFKESFEARHGVRLSFMSFFGRACVLALQQIPQLNAEIRSADIVYKRHVHLGVAVQTPRGLVVPIVHHADARGFGDLEREIARLATAARENRLALDDLSSGTFTVSNGGVFGSLLSTPILNPPQSGILGMHKIEKRPVVVDDTIVIRPMMYLALSYDHRIVDGEQAVTFLVSVKQRLEDPERMLLDV
jgi:2-oxoglutarate dehydrogenase E2 component (dihydrolipoamide succinyltransferase)